MASHSSLPELLDSLRQSISSVSEAVPQLSTLTPTGDGVSLLDVKNELLLSYLEHMVFLILLKLRNAASGASSKSQLDLEHSELGQSVVQKLVELRVYLEKGVRPLEEKLRFQIERALDAAENAERRAKAATAQADSEDEEDEDDSDAGDKDDDGDEEEEAVPTRMLTTDDADGENVAPKSAKPTGVYKPPKRLAAIMPGTTTATTATEWSDRKERKARQLKSSILDEFVADEYSSVPVAQPSIGTNIGDRGRHMKTDAERRREDERREYEETNYVRLPKESKKARGKTEGGARGRMSFGGEEWRDIGDGVDRINELTRRRKSGGSGGGSSVRALMEKSRKRGRDTADGPRGSGTNTVALGGERFQKRAKNQR